MEGTRAGRCLLCSAARGEAASAVQRITDGSGGPESNGSPPCKRVRVQASVARIPCLQARRLRPWLLARRGAGARDPPAPPPGCAHLPLAGRVAGYHDCVEGASHWLHPLPPHHIQHCKQGIHSSLVNSSIASEWQAGRGRRGEGEGRGHADSTSGGTRASRRQGGCCWGGQPPMQAPCGVRSWPRPAAVHGLQPPLASRQPAAPHAAASAPPVGATPIKQAALTSHCLLPLPTLAVHVTQRVEGDCVGGAALRRGTGGARSPRRAPRQLLRHSTGSPWHCPALCCAVLCFAMLRCAVLTAARMSRYTSRARRYCPHLMATFCCRELGRWGWGWTIAWGGNHETRRGNPRVPHPARAREPQVPPAPPPPKPPHASPSGLSRCARCEGCRGPASPAAQHGEESREGRKGE